MSIAELIKSLQWPVAGGILTTGFVIVYKFWRFFTGDFLSPWRTDTATARDEAGEARADAAKARTDAEQALARAFRCEAREARLLYHLERHGISIPSALLDDDQDPQL